MSVISETIDVNVPVRMAYNKRFKGFIEARRSATGVWRGEVSPDTALAR
jgi:hypothetical protein